MLLWQTKFSSTTKPPKHPHLKKAPCSQVHNLGGVTREATHKKENIGLVVVLVANAIAHSIAQTLSMQPRGPEAPVPVVLSWDGNRGPKKGEKPYSCMGFDKHSLTLLPTPEPIILLPTPVLPGNREKHLVVVLSSPARKQRKTLGWWWSYQEPIPCQWQTLSHTALPAPNVPQRSSANHLSAKQSASQCVQN